jgi:uncharacterized membrane protein YgaE (UPF0421/DUF939 family)
MFDRNERLALSRIVLSQRKTNRESLQLACLYAVQVLISASLLLAGYHVTHAGGVLWALVSSILVLQPGIEQSIAASAVRIAANTVGGLIGFVVGATLGTGIPQMLLALVATVFASEFCRLDLGLRTACVATVIVMTTNDGRVVTSSTERFSAVLIGCVLAVIVQLVAEQARRAFGWNDPVPIPSTLVPPPAIHPQQRLN